MCLTSSFSYSVDFKAITYQSYPYQLQKTEVLTLHHELKKLFVHLFNNYHDGAHRPRHGDKNTPFSTQTHVHEVLVHKIKNPSGRARRIPRRYHIRRQTLPIPNGQISIQIPSFEGTGWKRGMHTCLYMSSRHRMNPRSKSRRRKEPRAWSHESETHAGKLGPTPGRCHSAAGRGHCRRPHCWRWIR